MGERQRPVVEGDRFGVFALLSEHGAARGDNAPVRIDRIVGGRQQPTGELHLVEIEREASVFAGELAVVAAKNRGLLEHRKRPLLLTHGLKIAGEIERDFDVARVLRILLAPVLGRLLEIVWRWSVGARRTRLGLRQRLGRRIVERERVGSAGKLGAAADHQARGKAQ